MKLILIFIILSLILVSCGKKSEPNIKDLNIICNFKLIKCQT